MSQDKQKDPGINIVKIQMLESEAKIIQSFDPKKKYNLEAKYDFANNLSDNEHEGSSTLSVTVEIIENGDEDKKVFAIFKCKYLGQFSTDLDSPNMELKQFLEYNAHAMLYSYVREHFTNLSLKCGVTPIYLPIINIIAMIDSIKSQTLNKK
jgi:preprotein translocase subunit SecB